MNSKQVKVTVLLRPAESRRLDAFCEERGHKKSTLIARLVRDYLNQEGFAVPGTEQERVEAPGDGH
ncbi:MAG: hypothetical protein IT345_15360 [Trueperaceae bacterium]|nr:hypothetical protein [Trueperaceae bacterium]